MRLRRSRNLERQTRYFHNCLMFRVFSQELSACGATKTFCMTENHFRDLAQCLNMWKGFLFTVSIGVRPCKQDT